MKIQQIAIAGTLALAGCFSTARVYEKGNEVYSVMGHDGVHTEQKASVDSRGNEAYSMRTIGIGLDGKTYKEVDQGIFASRKDKIDVPKQPVKTEKPKPAEPAKTK